jgi:hypothetical protein
VARCQYLLQQGRTVADLLYLTPENAPHVFLAPESAYEYTAPAMPDRKGYNFDGCPPSLLYSAKAEDGKIVFPSGASYRLLALPCWKTMTPTLLEKIRELVSEGAIVLGLPPEKSPSLSAYPACDRELQQLAEELWGGTEAPETLSVRPYGKGHIIWGKELQTHADKLYPPYDITAGILAETLPPDFESEGSIRYTHRTMKEADIYFVSNRSGKPAAEQCKFRITGAKPERWNPITGERTALPEYAEAGGQTLIPLRFDTDEGYFIVFRDKTTAPSSATNFPEIKPLSTLEAPWAVSFDPAWGGPQSVVFEQLTDWTQHPDEGIKYYSGTAFYRQTFDLPTLPEKETLYLDLGKVSNMARIRLNGKELGVVWTFPWRVDITQAAKAKGNTLEIEVVNLWCNRLIGDDRLPKDEIQNGQYPDWLLEGKPRTSGRYTFSTHRHFSKDHPLIASGLIGPVRILTTNK